MQIKFTKMHGLGNDFMVIDGINQTISLTSMQISQLADRHRGVGFDQLLLVEASTTAGVDFKYRIFNADGSEVAQCGNGARCLARFVQEQGLTTKKRICVETRAGKLELISKGNGLYSVNMGIPLWLPEQIPFLAKEPALVYSLNIPLSMGEGSGERVFAHNTSQPSPLTPLPDYRERGTVSTKNTDHNLIYFSTVNIGNPHCVLQVDSIDTAPVKEIGSLLTQHPLFPEGVNVGFMEIKDRQNIRLRVYERGAGETLACGSGACAAVMVGRRLGLLDAAVKIQLLGGQLEVEWGNDGLPVWMTGAAESVFVGVLGGAFTP